MSLTLSTMRPLGSSAIDFSLPDVRSSKWVSLGEYSKQPLLLMFICNHCPFVVHIADKMTALANHYQEAGFGVIAISANDALSYPQDGPGKMQIFAERYEFEFAYCYDESQQTAKNYDAVCTPDFFVYDQTHKLRYRGQMDGSRPGNDIAVTGENLEAALKAVLSGNLVNEKQLPSMGCNIKWKSE